MAIRILIADDHCVVATSGRCCRYSLKDVASQTLPARFRFNTVETYRARMMDKLGIHDLAGLIKFAIQQGIASFE